MSCLEDEWDYIDRPCSSGWMRGYQIALIQDCKPSLTTCHSFVSGAQQQGQWTNYTETLALGEYCTVEVDATAFVAHVVFDNALTLGIQIDSYRIGNVIDVSQGQTKTITVYNGDTSGAITFTLAFSSALSGIVASAWLLALAIHTLL